MRSRRLKLLEGEAYYHCITRTVAGAFLLGDRDKEHFRLLLHRVAGFCGLEVVAHAIMSNHVHILVRVPDPSGPEARPGDAELARRLLQLYPNRRAWAEEQAGLLMAGGESAAWLRRALWARMGDVSAFMKELKQLFSRWYNAQHQRFGTLWAERFKSVLVEGNPRVLRLMAAYIDLNPVRAGLCKDPADYRFCSYAEAVAGVGSARRGLALAFGGEHWAEIRERYRCYLFQRGHHSPAGGGGRSYTREEVEAVLERGGRIEIPDLLRRRLRYFAEGRIFGTEGFVRRQLELPERMHGRRRRARPRRVLERMGEVSAGAGPPLVEIPDPRVRRGHKGGAGPNAEADPLQGGSGCLAGLAVHCLGRRAVR